MNLALKSNPFGDQSEYNRNEDSDRNSILKDMDEYFYRKFRYQELNNSKLIFLRPKKPNDNMMTSIFSSAVTPQNDVRSPKIDYFSTNDNNDLANSVASPLFMEKKEGSQIAHRRHKTLTIAKFHSGQSVHTENETPLEKEKRKYSILTSMRCNMKFIFYILYDISYQFDVFINIIKLIILVLIIYYFK